MKCLCHETANHRGVERPIKSMWERRMITLPCLITSDSSGKMGREKTNEKFRRIWVTTKQNVNSLKATVCLHSRENDRKRIIIGSGIYLE